MSASKFLVVCSVAVLVSLPALAWDNTNTGPGPKSIADGGPSQAQQATAAARSIAAARNTAVQRASQRVVVNNTYAGANGSGDKSSGASDPASSSYGRGYGSRGYQEPASTAYAPSFGTANPCVGRSASLGAQFQLFGLSAGGQQFDYGCAAERIGNLLTVGQKLDFAYQCRDDSRFRQSAYDIGVPCPADQEKFQREHSAPLHAEQVSAVLQPKTIPDWCLTASPAERRRHPACNQ